MVDLLIQRRAARRPGCGGLRVRAVAAAVAAACACVGAAPIRNVILCIGDGMGPGQVEAGRCYKGAPLVFEAFPFQARVSTLAAGGVVTDSAAAATALATGYKAADGVVSQALPGDGADRETVLETYARLGKSTGLVTTSYLTDATPAGFGAHASSRYDQTKIASDYLARTRPNVLFGGGGNSLWAEDAAAAGYRVAGDAAGLLALRDAPEDHVAGLFGWGALPYVYDGLDGLPSLTQMADVALARLSRDPDGFFLMVEGGRIDHACHANDILRCVTEVAAFDEAVRRICAWASNRVDTLVLVTADHETGGLRVVGDRGAGACPDVTWSTGGHTGASVGAYGLGANASRVGLLTDNTEVHGVACSEALMPATGVGVARLSASRVQSVWAVNSGDVCRVEYSSTLAPPVWQTGGTATATCTRISFEMSPAAPGGRGFYRVITAP